MNMTIKHVERVAVFPCLWDNNVINITIGNLRCMYPKISYKFRLPSKGIKKEGFKLVILFLT